MDGYFKCKLEIFNFNLKHALRDFGLASREMSNVSCLICVCSLLSIQWKEFDEESSNFPFYLVKKKIEI